ncbi:hypothetical protein FGG08_005414 [Glutinoglossum americanum]|uniref:Uncharacterized protein n=1 Tax=Glutinoglossum americanum TaxID=1670608 RepID=A0A9P8L1V4_9PEZI|nr:hypothetical protein FGG08_005414 [Glutinoglossum americanum]
MLLGDVVLCFDLRPHLDIIEPSSPPSSSDRDIGLWVRRELEHLSLEDGPSLFSCIYVNSPRQILDLPIALPRLGTPPAEGSNDNGIATVEEYGQGDEEMPLNLSLSPHGCGRCVDTGGASTHMENGTVSYWIHSHIPSTNSPSDEQRCDDYGGGLEGEMILDNEGEQDIILISETEGETARQRKEVWEGLVKRAYREMGQAGGVEVGSVTV